MIPHMLYDEGLGAHKKIKVRENQTMTSVSAITFGILLKPAN